MLNIMIATIWGVSIYLLLSGSVFRVILGLALLAQAVNMFIFFGAGESRLGMPLLGQTSGETIDPVPQALILTAIVISFVLFIFCIVLLLKFSYFRGRSDIKGQIEVYKKLTQDSKRGEK